MKATAQRQLFELTTVDWATPAYLFDPLHAEFSFTLDVCASEQNARLPRYFTQEQDGLAQDWSGERCWMNPPYGKVIGRWCEKAAASDALVVGLLPVRTDTGWWHDYVMGAEIRFLRGRVKYENKRANGGSYAPFPSAVVVWR